MKKFVSISIAAWMAFTGSLAFSAGGSGHGANSSHSSAPHALHSGAHGGHPPVEKRSVPQGVRVEFSVENADDGNNASTDVREGGYARVIFRVTDEKTGAPVSSLDLAAWVSLTGSNEGNEDCRDRIKRYVQGLLGLHADIDLNQHFILVMNSDRTISIIDPLMGVGGITHLFGMIVLQSPGEDWVASPDGKHLFVTMPQMGLVAKVDLESFKVAENLPAGSVPVRVVLHPDGTHLWVGNDGRNESGVTVIDLHTQATTFIKTGSGHHEIVFSEDGRYAFVTNSQQNTLSVVDARRLEKIKDLAVGENPIAVAFSELRNSVYVASEGDGTIAVVDAKALELRRTIRTDPGAITLRFTPGGRWAFAVNFRQDRVDVLDAEADAIAHRIAVGRQPHQVVFTHTYAYVRHLGTSDVVLIKMADIGGSGLPESHKVAFGNQPPGQYRYTSLADSITSGGHMGAVLSANPAEKVLFHYMEGMMVPMGSYSTYGRIPRAVTVVDRRVREIGDGLYGAKIRIPKSGNYNAAVLVQSPRHIQCFTFEAKPAPAATAQKGSKHAPIKVNYSPVEQDVPAGSLVKINFSILGASDNLPVMIKEGVWVVATRMPGNRQDRLQAKHLGGGRFEAEITPEQAGTYLVFISIPALDIDDSEIPYLSFRARGKTSSPGS